MDDEMLILLVQEREYIYNKKHHNFKNLELKKNAWKEISTLIGMAGNIIYKMFVLKC